MPDIITKEIVQANNPDLVIQSEVYRPVKGYETRYMVSNYGNVITLDTRRGDGHLRLNISNAGYYLIYLYQYGKCYGTSIHRLVAKAFLPEVEGKHIVNHKDGNKLNNYVDNLEWCTYSENVQHAIDTGLLVPNVGPFMEAGKIAASQPVLIEETGEVFASYTDCDNAKGFSRGFTTRMICNSGGFSETMGYHFKPISQDEYLAIKAGTLVFEPHRYDEVEYVNRGLHHNAKCIRIVETGECFPSSSACDRKYGLPTGATGDTLKRDDKYYGKMDWHIERISKEEYVAWTKNPIIKEHKPNIEAQCNLKWCRNGYCVKVVETGECFPTAKECDKKLNLPKDFTSKVISKHEGYYPKRCNYHFIKITQKEYLDYANKQSV